MNLAYKKDFYIVSIVGLIFAIFLVIALENTRPIFWHLTPANVLLLTVGFTVFANMALTIGGWLGQKFLFIWQFVKFAAVGSMNTALDVGLVNLLSLIFKVYSGFPIVIFNIISVIVAMTNSYFLNKFWSFKSGSPIAAWEFGKFAAVSLTALTINTAIVYLLTTIIGAPPHISAPIWENIAKLIAVPVTLFINFAGYKFLVFKK